MFSLQVCSHTQCCFFVILVCKGPNRGQGSLEQGAVVAALLLAYERKLCYEKLLRLSKLRQKLRVTAGGIGKKVAVTVWGSETMRSGLSQMTYQLNDFFSQWTMPARKCNLNMQRKILCAHVYICTHRTTLEKELRRIINDERRRWGDL